MRVPEPIYRWEKTYMQAVCETDKNLMFIRIYEALVAIEQRRLGGSRLTRKTEH